MMKNSKLRRILLLLACAVLLASLSVGATLAYLTSTDEVKNTFTVGTVNIRLDEADVYETGETDDMTKLGTRKDNVPRVRENTYRLLPGKTYEKDPMVTVLDGSEDCWVFVKVTKSANYDAYLEEYVMNTDGSGNALWEEAAAIDANTKVYRYKTVSKAGDTLQILKDNQVKVLTSVQKADMETLTDTTCPALTFDAYAIQAAHLVNAAGEAVTDAPDVWALVVDTAK